MTAAIALFALLFAFGMVLGYLWWLSRSGDPARPEWDGEWPSVLIVVPVLDEAPLIEAKLANLRAMTYDGPLRVAIVDGGSVDGTAERVEAIADGAAIRLERTHLRNKVAQLNAALRQAAPDEWVLVTDADAWIPPDGLRRMARLALADPAIAVVGAAVRPRAAHPLERLHWRLAEWMRRREYRRGSAGIVSAPCYLVRPGMLRSLPADAVADDVYVALAAGRSGGRVAVADVAVHELRSPRTLASLAGHKHRKARAYMREVFRFLPDALGMPSRTVFLWRAALLLVVPAAICTGTLALGIAGMTHLPGEASAGLAAGGSVLGAAAWSTRVGRDALLLAALALLLAAVAMWALLTYPFSRQTACYPRLPQPAGSCE